jgi:hypothetical protein
LENGDAVGLLFLTGSHGDRHLGLGIGFFHRASELPRAQCGPDWCRP